jgi:hypothetical protein
MNKPKSGSHNNNNDNGYNIKLTTGKLKFKLYAIQAIKVC